MLYPLSYTAKWGANDMGKKRPITHRYESINIKLTYHSHEPRDKPWKLKFTILTNNLILLYHLADISIPYVLR